MTVRHVFEGTSALPLAPAGVEDLPVDVDGTDSASRERAVTAAADAAAAPPGCTCGGNGVCLRCFFAAADTVEQRMMAAALEATERALAREVTS